MAFRMVCPKCGTPNYSIERERSTYSRAEPVASLVFACTCGKRLYGKQVGRRVPTSEKSLLSRTPRTERKKSMRVSSKRLSARKKMRRLVRQWPIVLVLKPIAVQKKRQRRSGASRSRSSVGESKRFVSQRMVRALRRLRMRATSVRGSFATKGQAVVGPFVERARTVRADYSNKNARWRHKQRKATPKSAKA